ncbi:MAG: trypsin-like peptidase domain-containing protein [Dehalococcoidia bacterium]
MNRNMIAVLIVVAALLFGAGAGAGLLLSAGDGGDGEPQTSATASTTPQPELQDEGRVSTSEDCLSAADVYERLRPAVVEITVSSQNTSPFGLPQQGQGSGIVIDSDGTVLTNQHVVEGAAQIEVRFVDGTTAGATMLGSDPGNDLALIRVDDPDLVVAVATLGSSSDLRVGDAVLAIGNPFSLEGTLTQGIVSALDRTYAAGGSTRPIRGMIQTDAPVNPGNSGGPLINCRGEVVGINTLIENPTGDNVNVGIAFAVASDTAKASLAAMLADETVAHPWLGIAGLEVDAALAAELGLSVDEGVYITYVASDSPADRAGLVGAFDSEAEAQQASDPVSGGDVIVAVDGEPVTSVEDLAGYLDLNKQPGDGVALQVDRDGDELSIDATLAEWPG